MLTKEANERLTQVGMGTPMGALLRRYWHPVATLPELLSEPVLAVTVLGENLALYRTEAGDMGLVAQRCPHRGASLAYGIPEADGLRCAYHGWKFDGRGTCLEQPAEPGDNRARPVNRTDECHRARCEPQPKGSSQRLSGQTSPVHHAAQRRLTPPSAQCDEQRNERDPSECRVAEAGETEREQRAREKS